MSESKSLSSRIATFPRLSKAGSLLLAGALIAGIATADWRAVDELPLGFLYLLPMLILGRFIKPWQLFVVALVCTYLTEEFDEFAWSIRTGLPRDVLYLSAFFAIGVFVHQVTYSRRVTLSQMQEIELQSAARLEAEQQLTALIESSPAAIVTAGSDGAIIIANEAAHRLLLLRPGTLIGQQLDVFFPSLALLTHRAIDVPLFRTVMQSRGRRSDGETFLAEICFSTYLTAVGPRLAAMILDSSEDLRSREEASLHQMLHGSRIAVAAISHEIRNLSGAVAAVHRTLSRRHASEDDRDFEALGNLVMALERVASLDLRPHPEKAQEVDLLNLLDDLKIVIGPSIHENEIQLLWEIEPDLASVWADGSNLMQILLNLTTNSIRALERKNGDRLLSVIARHQGDSRVAIRVVDNGGGISDPSQLFSPFQTSAQSTGLGLYLARAFARSFGGDLRYEPRSNSACFVVELTAVKEDTRTQ